MIICENCIHKDVCGLEGYYEEALKFCANKIEERPHGEGEWITVEENLWNLLEDHYWYLIVHKDYGTPMKAKYHSDCPHFTFFDAGGEEVCYLFENKITHYMELPDIPTGGQK